MRALLDLLGVGENGYCAGCMHRTSSQGIGVDMAWRSTQTDPLMHHRHQCVTVKTPGKRHMLIFKHMQPQHHTAISTLGCVS